MEKIKKLFCRRDCSLLKSGILIAMAMNFLFFVYAPLEMYFNNKADLLFGIVQVLKVIIPLFVLGFMAGSIILLILWFCSNKAFIAGVTGYFIAYLCTYIQGTFLIKELPRMDGGIFDWNACIAGRLKSYILWIFVTISVVILYRFIKCKKFLAIVNLLSICMTLMLTITGIILCITTKSYRSDEIIATFDKEFEMSSDKNFIILVLDAVNSKTTAQLFEEYPEYREIFTDFTYYPNMIGAYAYTQTSVPFILTGEWYENEEDFDMYRTKAFASSPLFSKLEQNGYTMGLYADEISHDASMPERFNNIVNLDRTVTSYAGAAKCMIKFAGFRYGFFDLKKYFNINLFECYFYFTPVEYTPYTMSNQWFYASLHEEDIELINQKNFKYIHISGAHVPWTTDKYLNDIGESDYKSMVEASFVITKAYLDKLKAAGVYDNSVIIVMADHGHNTEEEDNDYNRQIPFFCVKGYNEKHEFAVSDAPVSYEDLQGAFSKLLDDYPGSNIFEYQEGDSRERRFLFYQYGVREHMTEYIQTGHAFDEDKFIPSGRVYDYN